MTNQQKKYLSDILKAIELIESFTGDTPDFDSYSTDDKTQSAIERQLGIIGEAANKLDKNVNIELTNFHRIIGLRNRLIHAYDHIDNTIVWTVVKRYLPKLKEEVKTLLK